MLKNIAPAVLESSIYVHAETLCVVGPEDEAVYRERLCAAAGFGFFMHHIWTCRQIQ